jgi:hypothetical protein
LQEWPGSWLIHCIFGSPFRQAVFDQAWRSLTVVAIAHAIYDDRRNWDTPVLADALQEAGCSGAELLAHLRSPRPHYRGCWALDSVLGKS